VPAGCLKEQEKEEDALAARFIEWLISDDGQACIEQVGDVPLG